MKATVDGEGRIQLGEDLQRRLGVRPGDDLVFEKRGEEWLVRPASAGTGLSREDNVLVHRGACTVATDSLAQVREERSTQLMEGVRQ
jgi:bifunctional DNA-binding transcriptional regulator/antitoxin component of YhaV-PrlF toxin-antitoxin module